MRIAICDDSSIDCGYIRGLVTAWGRENAVQTVIDTFPSAEAFLFHYADYKNYDLLLLDIEMEKMDGVTMAKTIRKENDAVQIVFITGFSEYIAEGYDVAALHYLMKPIHKEKLFEVLNRAYKKTLQNERCLYIEFSDEMVRIPYYEIRFIDVDRNYVTIHAKKDYRVKRSLREIETELDERFFRIGRSAIVNLGFVQRVTKTAAILSDGIAIPLPRGFYDSLNRAIIDQK